MSALLILNYDVLDARALEQYREDAAPLLLTRGSLLTSTPATRHLAEAPGGGTHTVILRFDDVATARTVYESAEYQELVARRLRSTRPHVAMIVPVDVPPAG
jgi:uncharacterized protein (DUF1330 family)